MVGSVFRHRAILFLGIAAVLALAVLIGRGVLIAYLYPSLECRAHDYRPSMSLIPGSEGETEFPALNVHFTWNPADLPTASLLLSTCEQPEVPRRCPKHELHLFVEGDKLQLEEQPSLVVDEDESQEQVGFSYEPSFLRPTLLRMPDGSTHPQYHLLLRQEMTRQPYFREAEKAVALTELVIDPLDGTVDIVTPDIPEDIDAATYRVQHICRAEQEPALPSRFCGTETEQSLQRYLFLVASMHNAESARRLLPAVIARGQKLVDTACDTEQSFPACWGAAADTARANHRRILPYLLRLRELDCFDVPELAAFINSPLFARLFGESWSSPKSEG